jgi:hypothetical protein
VIDESLADGRARIEHLAGIRGLLKKIEFLFQLPSRLKKSVEMGAHAQAVKYYSISNRALRRYSNIASFKAIQEEADAIIGGLRDTLRAQLTDAGAAGMRVRDLVDTVTLLLQLEEPAAELRALYIDRGAAPMRLALEEARSSTAFAAASGGGRRGSSANNKTGNNKGKGGGGANGGGGDIDNDDADAAAADAAAADADADDDSDQDQQGPARERLLKDFKATPAPTPTAPTPTPPRPPPPTATVIKTNKDPPVNNFKTEASPHK